MDALLFRRAGRHSSRRGGSPSAADKIAAAVIGHDASAIFDFAAGLVAPPRFHFTADASRAAAIFAFAYAIRIASALYAPLTRLAHFISDIAD